jgi:hypothetical protein
MSGHQEARSAYRRYPAEFAVTRIIFPHRLPAPGSVVPPPGPPGALPVTVIIFPHLIPRLPAASSSRAAPPA